MFQTHGFPPELFETLAAERNLAFDWKGFHEEMEQHGIESGGGPEGRAVPPRPAGSPQEGHARQHASSATTRSEVDDAKVIGIIANDQLCDQLDEIDHEQPIVVVLDKTPFYGEMGGQVGDAGEIAGARLPLRGHRHASRRRASRSIAAISARASSQLGAVVTARVDAERRQAIRRAHSATHLLHHALQKHLGKHALQQGSKVDDDWLRFDFANPAAVESRGADSRSRTRSTANVLAGAAIRFRPTCRWPRPARPGAMMLFGEKYPDVVRMVADRRVQQGALRRHAPGQHAARSGCSRSSAKRAWPPARGGSRP